MIVGVIEVIEMLQSAVVETLARVLWALQRQPRSMEAGLLSGWECPRSLAGHQPLGDGLREVLFHMFR